MAIDSSSLSFDDAEQLAGDTKGAGEEKARKELELKRNEENVGASSWKMTQILLYGTRRVVIENEKEGMKIVIATNGIITIIDSNSERLKGLAQKFKLKSICRKKGRIEAGGIHDGVYEFITIETDPHTNRLQSAFQCEDYKAKIKILAEYVNDPYLAKILTLTLNFEPYPYSIFSGAVEKIPRPTLIKAFKNYLYTTYYALLIEKQVLIPDLEQPQCVEEFFKNSLRPKNLELTGMLPTLITIFETFYALLESDLYEPLADAYKQYASTTIFSLQSASQRKRDWSLFPDKYDDTKDKEEMERMHPFLLTAIQIHNRLLINGGASEMANNPAAEMGQIYQKLADTSISLENCLKYYDSAAESYQKAGRCFRDKVDLYVEKMQTVQKLNEASKRKISQPKPVPFLPAFKSDRASHTVRPLQNLGLPEPKGRSILGTDMYYT